MGKPQWVPHVRETWPFQFGTLIQDVVFSEWLNHSRDSKGNPIMVDRMCPVGTKVRIVMVSRFGDIGITDKLDNEIGYLARGIDIDKINEFLTDLR